MHDLPLSRRSFLAGVAATVLAACSPALRRGKPTSSATATLTPSPVDCEFPEAVGPGAPLWETALQRGVVYGSSTATWQISDGEYRRLFAREASILFTEDDMLWYRLRPSPKSGLDFRYSDRIVDFAENQGMLVFGAHLAWDEGFGEGWTQSDLTGLTEKEARHLLFGTIDSLVHRYRGRVAAWSAVNEAVDAYGVRSDVPWYSTIGPSYISESFERAHAADPRALLAYNDFGFETNDEYGDRASDKRAAVLDLLDGLLKRNVPVHALGVQAHLTAGGFAEKFDPGAYRRFLGEVADRGLKILVTELDVLDDGLPADVKARDRGVADTYRRFLDAALDEPAVVSVITFGLSDRYTWLQEDYPRDDKAPRRPLAFDEKLRPKPAYHALEDSLEHAVRRKVFQLPPRC